MSDLFGNHIVSFPTRRLICCSSSQCLSLDNRCDSINADCQILSRLVGNPTMWFPTRSDTNWPVQAQKRARSLKFQTEVEEELYYPSSENKGADQLRSYREADLRLFSPMQIVGFPMGRLIYSNGVNAYIAWFILGLV